MVSASFSSIKLVNNFFAINRFFVLTNMVEMWDDIYVTIKRDSSSPLLHKGSMMNVSPIRTGKRGRPRLRSGVGCFVGSVCCLACGKTYLKFLPSGDDGFLPEMPFPVIFDRSVDFLYVAKFAKLPSISLLRFRLVFTGDYDHIDCEHFPYETEHAFHVRRVYRLV